MLRDGGVSNKNDQLRIAGSPNVKSAVENGVVDSSGEEALSAVPEYHLSFRNSLQV